MRYNRLAATAAARDPDESHHHHDSYRGPTLGQAVVGAWVFGSLLTMTVFGGTMGMIAGALMHPPRPQPQRRRRR